MQDLVPVSFMHHDKLILAAEWYIGEHEWYTFAPGNSAGSSFVLELQLHFA
jgi:hypothetical protein